MASIWFQRAGHGAKKLEGNLPVSAIGGRFKAKVAELARIERAEVKYQDHGVALLTRTVDGVRFSVWTECFSPPSAPETGQPKIIKGERGIVVDKTGDIKEVRFPIPPPEKAHP